MVTTKSRPIRLYDPIQFSSIIGNKLQTSLQIIYFRRFALNFDPEEALCQSEKFAVLNGLRKVYVA